MSLWSRITNVFRGEGASREIDEELEAHFAEAMEQGRDPDEARRAFGSSLHHRERSRDVRDAHLAGFPARRRHLRMAAAQQKGK
jgi:hypothetical protein